MGDCLRVGKLSHYLTSHPGQLSLARDELPRNGPQCLCEIFFFFWSTQPGSPSWLGTPSSSINMVMASDWPRVTTSQTQWCIHGHAPCDLRHRDERNTMLLQEHAHFILPTPSMRSRMVLDLRSIWLRVRIPASLLSSATLGKLLTHVPLSPSSIGTSQWAVMRCGWEGNRRSDVALATRHRH